MAIPFVLLWILAVVAGAYGYVENIIKLVADVGLTQPNVLLDIVRVLAIPFGFGAILGYF